MPIVRTYLCNDCGYRLQQTLRADQWEEPAPECPQCAKYYMDQEFKPPAIVGSNLAKARAIATRIAEEDFGVADMDIRGRRGEANKVRYQDAPATQTPSNWMAANATLQQGMAIGRQTRLEGYDGLNQLHAGLKSGTIPDILELSKRRAIRR